MTTASTGRVLTGSFGVATEILVSDPSRPAMGACVATWFLHCPGQSPMWSHFQLSVVHLRPIEGHEAIIRVPHATHEVILAALDPQPGPVPTDVETWRLLHPINVTEQVQLPSDASAASMLAICAAGVVHGVLPAEPPLSGAVEPWRTALLKTAAHERGEPHAP